MKLQDPRVLRLLLGIARRTRSKPRPPRVKYGAVEIAPYLNNARAAASISADFELAWAWREWGVERAERMGFRERKNVPLILEALDQAGIPITWATVGHLFLEACDDQKNGLAHSHMPRPPANRRWEGDWYQHDPASNLATRPAWYCPDLIRSIQQAKTPHELGCHSFSHIEFSRECSSEELVRAEILECQKVMAQFDVRPQTLVYPFNIMGHQHLHLLATLGVVAVRHRDPRFVLSYPERDQSGVYKIYETMALRGSRYYSQPAKALALLEKAVERGLCYHFWFHPSNPTAEFLGIFQEILEQMVRLREQAKLWIATMKDLVAYCEARRTTTVETSWNNQNMALKLSSSYSALKYGDTDITLCIECRTRPSAVKLFQADKPRTLQPPDYRYKAEVDVLTVSVPCRKDTSLELYFERT